MDVLACLNVTLWVLTNLNLLAVQLLFLTILSAYGNKITVPLKSSPSNFPKDSPFSICQWCHLLFTPGCVFWSCALKFVFFGCFTEICTKKNWINKSDPCLTLNCVNLLFYIISYCVKMVRRRFLLIFIKILICENSNMNRITLWVKLIMTSLQINKKIQQVSLPPPKRNGATYWNCYCG